MHKIELTLEGLNCANCAVKIENAVAKLNDVEKVSLNFLTKKLVVETKKSEFLIIEEIKEIVNSIEPDVNVAPYKENESIKINPKALITILLPIILMLIAAFTKDTMTIFILYLISYITASLSVFHKAFKNIVNKNFFDENFLMSLASLGAFLIGERNEAIFVMVFYKIGEFLEEYAVNKSRKKIQSVKQLKPEYVNLKVENQIRMVNPSDIIVGDTIIVKAGERIPIDGIVLSGKATLDTSAITGESQYIIVEENQEVISGAIPIDSSLEIKTTCEYKQSTLAKIIDLIENASQQKAKSERFITSFARIWTPSVIIAAIIISILVPLIFNQPFEKWLYKGLLFLVISCPCALVLSVPLSYFAAIGRLSSYGVIVKGSNFIDLLPRINTMFFDKTGTLTKGEFSVAEIYTSNISEDKLIYYVAHAEAFSNHPLALSILKYYNKDIAIDNVTEFSEYSGRGVCAIVDKVKVICGTKDFLIQNNIDISGEYLQINSSNTKIYVSIDGNFSGLIILEDTIKDEAKNFITYLKQNGVEDLAILSGDDKLSVERIANELNIGKYYFKLLPEQKAEIISREKLNNRKVAFLGDGINDAPSLIQSDIGITFSNNQIDIAIESADIILIDNSLFKIPFLINFSKKVRRIVWQNIVFAIGIKIIFMLLGILGYANMWMGIFADVGVSLISILNALRLLII